MKNDFEVKAVDHDLNCFLCAIQGHEEAESIDSMMDEAIEGGAKTLSELVELLSGKMKSPKQLMLLGYLVAARMANTEPNQNRLNPDEDSKKASDDSDADEEVEIGERKFPKEYKEAFERVEEKVKNHTPVFELQLFEKDSDSFARAMFKDKEDARHANDLIMHGFVSSKNDRASDVLQTAVRNCPTLNHVVFVAYNLGRSLERQSNPIGGLAQALMGIGIGR